MITNVDWQSTERRPFGPVSDHAFEPEHLYLVSAQAPFAKHLGALLVERGRCPFEPAVGSIDRADDAEPGAAEVAQQSAVLAAEVGPGGQPGSERIRPRPLELDDFRTRVSGEHSAAGARDASRVIDCA